MDVTRADDTYTVKADLPGVAKDDIKVSIDGGQVSISGEVRKEKEEKKGEEVLRGERYYGKVARSFTLPQEVDQARVVAKYADGVLKLTLPLKAKTAGRTIAIQ
ncbi:18 kDa heat shock protein [compost metagenome]